LQPRDILHGLGLTTRAERDVALRDVSAVRGREREVSIRRITLQAIGEVLIERRLGRRVVVFLALVRR
jgi:hypothetical protein